MIVAEKHFACLLVVAQWKIPTELLKIECLLPSNVNQVLGGRFLLTDVQSSAQSLWPSKV